MSLAIDLPESRETWNAHRAPWAERGLLSEESDPWIRQKFAELEAQRGSLDQREQSLKDERDQLHQAQAALEQQWDRLEELRGATQQAAQQGAQIVKQEAQRLAKVQADLNAAQSALVAHRASWAAEQCLVLQALTNKLQEFTTEIRAAAGASHHVTGHDSPDAASAQA
jgi:hypothetical protein